jgi:hypothetical protein
VFDFVSAEDVLPKVLTANGFLPAVVATSGNTGPWTEPARAASCTWLTATRRARRSPIMKSPATSPTG